MKKKVLAILLAVCLVVLGTAVAFGEIAPLPRWSNFSYISYGAVGENGVIEVSTDMSTNMDRDYNLTLKVLVKDSSGKTVAALSDTNVGYDLVFYGTVDVTPGQTYTCYFTFTADKEVVRETKVVKA